MVGGVLLAVGPPAQRQRAGTPARVMGSAPGRNIPAHETSFFPPPSPFTTTSHTLIHLYYLQVTLSCQCHEKWHFKLTDTFCGPRASPFKVMSKLHPAKPPINIRKQATSLCYSPHATKPDRSSRAIAHYHLEAMNSQSRSSWPRRWLKY